MSKTISITPKGIFKLLDIHAQKRIDDKAVDVKRYLDSLDDCFPELGKPMRKAYETKTPSEFSKIVSNFMENWDVNVGGG